MKMNLFLTAFYVAVFFFCAKIVSAKVGSNSNAFDLSSLPATSNSNPCGGFMDSSHPAPQTANSLSSACENKAETIRLKRIFQNNSNVSSQEFLQFAESTQTGDSI